LKQPQSVLDALADAETLRLFARQHGSPSRFPAAWGVQDAIYSAQHHAAYIQRARYPKSAGESGRLAARAAFRAVPALRAAQQEGQ
jgi:hypothetical protein